MLTFLYAPVFLPNLSQPGKYNNGIRKNVLNYHIETKMIKNVDIIGYVLRILDLLLSSIPHC